MAPEGTKVKLKEEEEPPRRGAPFVFLKYGCVVKSVGWIKSCFALSYFAYESRIRVCIISSTIVLV